jgi:hypothetical protein
MSPSNISTENRDLHYKEYDAAVKNIRNEFLKLSIDDILKCNFETDEEVIPLAEELVLFYCSADISNLERIKSIFIQMSEIYERKYNA